MDEPCPGCGNKMSSYWPDIEKLSMPTLRHLLVTIDDLKDKLVMQFDRNILDMGSEPGLENLSRNDHLKCVHFLQELNLISGSNFGGIRVYHPKELEEIYEQIKKEMIKRETKEKPIPNFDKENSVLLIGDKKINITLKNDKPNEHYVLEYIFDNEEGLKAKSYYTEILKAKFSMEKTNQQSLYRSCQTINRKVNDQAGITKFLIVKSGETGYVQINPEFL